jgi:hypothetical protein
MKDVPKPMPRKCCAGNACSNATLAMDPSVVCRTCNGVVHVLCSYKHKDNNDGANTTECFLCHYGSRLLIPPVLHGPVEFTNEYLAKQCCRKAVCNANLDFETTIKCAVENCEKHIHSLCYEQTVGVGRERLFEEGDIANQLLFCNITHYTLKSRSLKAMKKQKQQSNNPKKSTSQRKVVQQEFFSWTEDGKNGVDDPNTSQRIILDWWMTPGNYADYREQRKAHYHRILLQKMMDAKVRAIRTEDSVAAKIKSMESDYRKAEDWAKGTGAGVLESSGQVTFNQEIVKFCDFYHDVHDIMSKRASSHPPVTSDNRVRNLTEVSVWRDATNMDTDWNNNNNDNNNVTPSDPVTQTSITTVVKPDPATATAKATKTGAKKKKNVASAIDVTEAIAASIQQEKDQRRLAAQNEVSATNALVEQRLIEKNSVASKARHEQYMRYKELVDSGMDNEDIIAIFPEHVIFVPKRRNVVADAQRAMHTPLSPNATKFPRMHLHSTPQASNSKKNNHETSPAFSTRSRK